jgi:hypothetical protein
MKHTRNLMNSLITCTIALALVSTVAAQTATDSSVKVIRVKGPARYSTGNNVWQPLGPGTVIRPGTVIQTSTEKGSYVDLGLGDATVAGSSSSSTSFKPFIPSSYSYASSTGSAYQPTAEQNMIRIWENTALGVDKLTSMQSGAEEVTETQLDLKAGRITGSVKKMSAASKFEIKLPNGVAGIRGTVFDISAEGVVRVFVGSMVVAWVDSKSGNVVTQVVMGGQQYDARSNQISPISEPDMQMFEHLVASMRVSTAVAPTNLALDRTIVTVSPVIGP